jgi:hypothetical protein
MTARTAARRIKSVPASATALAAALTLGLGLVDSNGALAQPQDEEPGIVRGPVTLLPEASAALRIDDNIYESDDYKIDSLVSLLGIGMGARYETGNSGWEATYRGDAGLYKHNSDDNYFDHRLNGRGIMQFGLRHRLEMSAGFEMLHEDRGTNISQGFGESIEVLVPEPDRYDRVNAAARYQFGARQAKGRLVLDGRYTDKEYTNNRERTRPFDFDQSYLSGTFFWRVLPKSSLLLQGSYAEVTYPTDFIGQSTRDSTTNRLLAGITWEATAKTTGTVKLGYLNKDFDAADRPTFRAPSWEVELRYEPRTYSIIRVETSRYDREFNFGFGGDFIDTAVYGVTWEHEWSERWSTETGLSYLDETFENSAAEFNREQETLQLDAALSFELRRTLDLELRYTLRDRDANIDRFQFGRNQIQLGLALAL